MDAGSGWDAGSHAVGAAFGCGSPWIGAVNAAHGVGAAHDIATPGQPRVSQGSQCGRHSLCERGSP